MYKILIIYINIFYLFQTTTSQYNYQNQYYQNSQQYQNQYYQPRTQQQYMDYGQMSGYQQPDQWRQYGSSGGKLPTINSDYTNSGECTCSCNKCENPKPCCIDACETCNNQGSQSEVVFVPYPYPLLVAGIQINNMQNNTNTTTKTTTEATTTISTTTPCIISQIYNRKSGNDKNKSEDINDILVKTPNNSKYMLTSIRRTKQNYVPKYGIVPIPDQLAEKLMSQIKDMKVLQTRRTLGVVESGYK